MKIRKWILTVGLLSSGSVAIAHSDHAPPPKVASCKAKDCTKAEVAAGVEGKVLPMLIQSGKLNSTWGGLKASSTTQKDFKSAKEWVLTVINDKVAEKAKQTLYVFVTLEGTLSGANFTGQ